VYYLRTFNTKTLNCLSNFSIKNVLLFCYGNLRQVTVIVKKNRSEESNLDVLGLLSVLRLQPLQTPWATVPLGTLRAPPDFQ
jgi:hypothetical protein